MKYKVLSTDRNININKNKNKNSWNKSIKYRLN